MCCSSKFETNSLLLHFCWFWWNFDQTINSIWRSLSLRCSHKIRPENFRKFLFSENFTHAARLRRHSLVYASSVGIFDLSRYTMVLEKEFFFHLLCLKTKFLLSKWNGLTCSMRLSARRANDSRLAGFVGGMEDGSGGVDIVKHFICYL